MLEKKLKSSVDRKKQKKSKWQYIRLIWLTCMLLGAWVLLTSGQILPKGEDVPPWPVPTSMMSSFHVMNG